MNKYIIEGINITKKYAHHTALNEVNIGIPEGKIFGLLGPNGAGKTSLIRIINQITAPDSGQILFDGQPLQSRHIEQVGYLPEERGLYKKMKVGEQLQYLAQLKGMPLNVATEKLKAWFIKFDIKDWWDKNVEDLSKGMQQKTQFIATVVHEPKLVILDEPFSGFDPINANLLKDEILELKKNGSTIIFSTHRMESVEELCDNIALINKAKVVLAGDKKQIKNDFKDHTFEIVTEGGIMANNELFNIVSQENQEDHLVKTILKKNPSSTNNEMLSAIIGQQNIISFSEKIPSFNEIFIKVVGESANELLA